MIDSANRKQGKRNREDFYGACARANPYILMELPFKDALYIRNSTLQKIVQPFSTNTKLFENQRKSG